MFNQFNALAYPIGLTTLLCLASPIHPFEAGAIFGGGDHGSGPFLDPYAAIVITTPLGETEPITGPTPPIPTGSINNVAINFSGDSIIGGENNVNKPYAVLVSSGGVRTTITGLPVTVGHIDAVTINSSGNCIIGGVQNTDRPYVSLVSSGGATSPLSGPAVPPPGLPGNIFSVSINASGDGIIGGRSGSPSQPYAALVASGGATTALTGNTPIGLGQINSVSINASGNCLIGGQHQGSGFLFDPYVARVVPGGATTMLTGDFPIMKGIILSVAINASGIGLIGGRDHDTTISFLPYVARVSGTTLTLLTVGDIPTGTGQINSVAINAFGEGLIGGEDHTNNTPYVARVSSGGVLTALTGPLPLVGTGSIDSVAINASGIGFIGGVDHGATTPYFALVSPLGVRIPLTGSALPVPPGRIFSVAISDSLIINEILNAVVPRSIGPYGSYFNSLFALNKMYERHNLTHHKTVFRKKKKDSYKEIGLLADAADHIRFRQSLRKKTIDSEPDDLPEPTYSLWGGAFGNKTHQKAEGDIPAFTNDIAGATLALDYLGKSDIVLGGGLAYAFNYVHYADGIGHAKINQEFATLYASWNQALFVNAALWGGLYQLDNERHTLAEITSTANTRGWLLSPHLELSIPRLYRDWIGIDPFVMVDWANLWQRHFTEEGPSGLNVVVNGQYSSLLRTELGIRVLQILHYVHGQLIFEEKGSWVNKKPFHVETSPAFFVGSISPFTIETFSSTVQNLGVAECSLEFIPTNSKHPYWSLDYQGEFGSRSHNHTLSLMIGKDF